MSQVIYTDGSCIPNPGSGGYAFVVLDKDAGIEWHVSGGEDNTTNNRMELVAVIEALKFTKSMKSDSYTIYSDSTYVINCASGKWKKMKNTDLWEIYDRESKNKHIHFIWVKSHNGDKYNEIVDQLAKKEAIEK